jgi:hypothetical protein
MSKKPHKPRQPPRTLAACNALGWRRLPGSTANYRNISDTRYPIGATISNRKMSDLSREARLGETTTKEQYTRGVKQGRFRYDAATQGRQFRANEGRTIRKEIPEVARRDAKLMIKTKLQGGYDALGDEEKERFHHLFERYPASSVREILGSPRRRKDVRSSASAKKKTG